MDTHTHTHTHTHTLQGLYRNRIEGLRESLQLPKWGKKKNGRGKQNFQNMWETDRMWKIAIFIFSQLICIIYLHEDRKQSKETLISLL